MEKQNSNTKVVTLDTRSNVSSSNGRDNSPVVNLQRQEIARMVSTVASLVKK